MFKIPAIPPSFSLPIGSRNALALRERQAVDALLAHEATHDDMGVLQVMAEVSLRTIAKARKLPHCKHLDPDQLKEAEKVMQRAGHAIKRAEQRYKQTGVYGLDAVDRACIQDMDDWYGALQEPGHIPRAVWLASLRDGALQKGGVKLPPWESLQ